MFLFIGGVAVYRARLPHWAGAAHGSRLLPDRAGRHHGLFGIWELIIGVLKPDPIKGNWSLRALIILPLSAVVFGVLMENVGFIPAMIALILVSAAGGQGIQVLGSRSLLADRPHGHAAVGIFIYGLGLPYPLFRVTGDTDHGTLQ